MSYTHQTSYVPRYQEDIYILIGDVCNSSKYKKKYCVTVYGPATIHQEILHALRTIRGQGYIPGLRQNQLGIFGQKVISIT